MLNILNFNYFNITNVFIISAPFKLFNTILVKPSLKL